MTVWSIIDSNGRVFAILSDKDKAKKICEDSNFKFTTSEWIIDDLSLIELTD
jgi:hypothetical protein